jgi:hypothetical protein
MRTYTAEQPEAEAEFGRYTPAFGTHLPVGGRGVEAYDPAARRWRRGECLGIARHSFIVMFPRGECLVLRRVRI